MIRFRLSTITALLAAALAAAVVAGCATRPATAPHAAHAPPASTAEIRAAVAAVTAHLPQYREVSGRWQSEATASTFKAYFDHGRLKYVAETAGAEHRGYAVNKYYYDAEAPFYFHGQGSVGGEDSLNPQPADIDVQLAFDARGHLIRSTKTINGREVPLEPGEAAAIYAHAGELRRQAKADLANRGDRAARP